MKDTFGFITAYHDFRESIDFGKDGILPELDDLVWCMLMGIPGVPADEDTSENGPIEAVDQRVAILKVVFVEVNGDRAEEFLDQGLCRYDQAAKMAKKLLKEAKPNSSPDDSLVVSTKKGPEGSL